MEIVKYIFLTNHTMEHIINCPDCGTNLEFRMLEVTEGVLEEMNVCLECGY